MLQSKRTWRVGESCLRLVTELLVTVCDAITGFDCDYCSSRMLSSSTANQNDYDDRVRAEIVATPARRDRVLRSIILFVIVLGIFRVLKCIYRRTATR